MQKRSTGLTRNSSAGTQAADNRAALVAWACVAALMLASCSQQQPSRPVSRPSTVIPPAPPVLANTAPASTADHLREAATSQHQQKMEASARLMKSMRWIPDADWDPSLSGSRMFDGLWKIDGMRFGDPSSSRKMVIFSDPGTGFDLALARQIAAAGPDLDANILVLPLGTGMFDPSSGIKVAVLSCLPNPEASWIEWARSPPDLDATNQSSWGTFLARHPLPDSCDRGPSLVRAFQAAQAIGVDYTPYVVFPDGQAWPTATPSLAALLSTLDFKTSSIDHPGDRVLNEE